jgi:hypothetical protein
VVGSAVTAGQAAISVSLGLANSETVEAVDSLDVSFELPFLVGLGSAAQAAASASLIFQALGGVSIGGHAEIDSGLQLALANVISTSGGIEMADSFSLSALANAGLSGAASGQQALPLGVIGAISAISGALTLAGLGLAVINTLTISGQLITLELSMPEGRTITIDLDNRLLTVARETRTQIVN